MVDVTEITALIIAISGAISAIFVPMWLAKRKESAGLKEMKDREEAAEVVSWDKMTTRLDSERANLQKRLDTSDSRHREEMNELEAEWNRRVDVLKSRVSELEEEVKTLRATLRTMRGI